MQCGGEGVKSTSALIGVLLLHYLCAEMVSSQNQRGGEGVYKGGPKKMTDTYNQSRPGTRASDSRSVPSALKAAV